MEGRPGWMAGSFREDGRQKPEYGHEEGEHMTDGKALEAQLKKRISERLREADRIEDKDLYRLIDDELYELSGRDYISLNLKMHLREALFNSFRRLDLLQELLDDKDVTEIMINGPDDIFVERRGRIERLERSFESRERLEDIIQQIVSRINRVVNTSNPIADAMLRQDGSRVHIVLPPIALNGPIVTIRKFPEHISMQRLIKTGSITKEAAEFLGMLVRAGYNIFISGGTASGKSTFLNALCEFIPEDERIITIEDTAELQITNVKNIVRLETRSKNSEGEGEISMSMLIKAALRMRPSRIIVGEVRGAEAADMLTAQNTGHDGALSTGHANSTEDMISRFESMVLMGLDIPIEAIRSRIASAIDIFVHLSRLPDGSRRVMEISEMRGYEEGRIRIKRLYGFDMEKKRLIRLSELKRTEKLRLRGAGAEAGLPPI